ncbi:hypothetical protein BLA60_04465 [Actinophytocola xinjiangensis]|uniref:Vitamin K epoxide reductase domain-containing protein n=1 Tax=Actinophytocola xinjiangensis TaxID=485602 RepID=A0A7Z0WSY3_9PSEU|nr:vitamin K epoxide reductase family protein [Actinophytocola xinjiangensis]OLF14383.1 hypothetical protein BLA60_04465 [Actinophytocola xinjiangensis]
MADSFLRQHVVGGPIGLAATIALTLEKLATLADPSYVPTCSIISCGSVTDSARAEASGFPTCCSVPAGCPSRR